MKRTLFIAIALLATISSVKAQAIREVNAQYGEFTVPAFCVNLPQNEDIVTDALNQRLKEAGLKTSKSKGYIASENQNFEAISMEAIDFYAKVETEGKKSNKVTVVTFFAKSPNLTISQSELNLNVRRFAESFPLYVQKFEAQQNASAEAKNLKQAQKEQSKATSALNSLDKSINKDQEKIESLKQDIVKYQAKIEECQKEIEKLNAKIEKNTDKRGKAEERVNSAQDKVNSSQSDLDRYRQQAE